MSAVNNRSGENLARTSKPALGEPFAPMRAGPKLWNAIEAARDLSDLDKRVLRLLVRLTQDRSWCTATVGWLARALGRSERAVFYALARLCDRGLVVREGKGCRGTTFRFIWSSAYERFQRLNRRMVQGVAVFEDGQARILQHLQGNPARACRVTLQGLAGFPEGSLSTLCLEDEQLNPEMLQTSRPNRVYKVETRSKQQQQQPSRNETLPGAAAAAGQPHEVAKRILPELISDLLPRQLDELLSSLAVERLVGLALWASEKAQAGQVKNAAGLLLAEARRGTEPPDEHLQRAKILLRQKEAELQTHKEAADAPTRAAEAARLWKAKLGELSEFLSPKLLVHIRHLRPLGFAKDGSMVLACAPPADAETITRFGVEDISSTLGIQVRIVPVAEAPNGQLA